MSDLAVTQKGSDVPTREQLLHLLAEASELEHNLLCSYLFALFSLKDETAADLSPDEQKSVKRWRDMLRGVCIEEMLHLAQVANLTVAVGAGPHFNRPNLPVGAGYHPAAVVVELTKFDLETLQHFIHLERPEGSDAPDAPSFVPEVPYRRQAQPGMLMPASPDYRTIGEFYAGLQTKMTAFCDAFGEERLFVGRSDLQMQPTEVQADSLHVVHDLATAAAAIEQIVRQGEGAPGESTESHFAQFISIQREYLAHAARRPGFAPAYPVGRNPVMRFPVSGAHTKVTHPEAFILLDASNAFYGFMLRCLAASYVTPWSDAARREGLLMATFKSMRALAIVGSELARRPASEESPDPVHAGVSFAMMRSTENLGVGRELGLLRERARELHSHLQALPIEVERRAELSDVFKAISTALSKASSPFV